MTWRLGETTVAKTGKTQLQRTPHNKNLEKHIDKTRKQEKFVKRKGNYLESEHLLLIGHI